MHSYSYVFVENFHVNNLVLKSLIFVGQGYPRKLFNLEHFPIYGIIIINMLKQLVRTRTDN